jgi:hypothetical protein
MSDSKDKPLYTPLVDGMLHTLMTIRKNLQKQIAESIQGLRDDAEQARQRAETAPKIHDA